MSYDFLWQIALILVSTKICGLITRRFQMPQVVGARLQVCCWVPPCSACCPATAR